MAMTRFKRCNTNDGTMRNDAMALPTMRYDDAIRSEDDVDEPPDLDRP